MNSNTVATYVQSCDNIYTVMGQYVHVQSYDNTYMYSHVTIHAQSCDNTCTVM